MALIRCDTFDGIGANTRAGLACIRRRTGIAVIAHRAVWFSGIGTSACGRITRSDRVALTQGRTNDGIGPIAHSILTLIRLCTAVAIVAQGSIGSDRIGTNSRARIANAGIVALTQGRAGDWVCSRANASLACIRLRTRIGIITGIAGEQFARTIGGRAGSNGTSIAWSGIAGRIATHAIGTKSTATFGVELARLAACQVYGFITVDRIRRRKPIRRPTDDQSISIGERRDCRQIAPNSDISPDCPSRIDRIVAR